MSDQPVIIDNTDPAVAIVTLNRPDKRNALSIRLMEELCQAVASASVDVHRRVLVLRGNGAAFCAGLDLVEATDATRIETSARALAEVYKVLCGSPLVTIAAVHGAVMGGGIGLMSACDLALAADDTQIAFPEVRRGLVAALVTCLVRRQIPDRRLRELVLLGETIAANQAMSIGIVNRVIPRVRLDAETRELSSQLIQGAPNAIVRTKVLLDDLRSRPISFNLERALRYHLEARDSAEAAEGIAAFREKRQPRWGVRNGQSKPSP